MLHKTRGIALKTTDYSESSVITQVFTEKFGLQSYLVQGAKKPKARIRSNMLQPLSLLDMIVYHKENNSLQRISELKQAPLLNSIPYHIIKSSVALFLNEMVYKCVKQQGTEEAMFNYVFSSVEWYDSLEDGIANFHLYFLTRFTRFLGFYPERPGINQNYFDMKAGSFTEHIPGHLYVMGPELATVLKQLLLAAPDELGGLKLNSVLRGSMLNSLIDYYRLHIDGFGEVRSHEILHEVLS
jgi:DNA repair protein RecO (recombination protein O)